MSTTSTKNKILAFDPSGNYYEGKGTTGWALYYNKQLTSVGQIRAIDSTSQYGYWAEHLNLIDALEPDVVVIEEYVLYASAKNAQIGSSFETVQLIGAMKYMCGMKRIEVCMQPANIKTRFTNEILLRKNIITQDLQKRYYALGLPVTQHVLDAIRHGEFFINFKLNKLKKEKENE